MVSDVDGGHTTNDVVDDKLGHVSRLSPLPASPGRASPAREGAGSPARPQHRAKRTPRRQRKKQHGNHAQVAKNAASLLHDDRPMDASKLYLSGLQRRPGDRQLQRGFEEVVEVAAVAVVVEVVVAVVTAVAVAAANMTTVEAMVVAAAGNLTIHLHTVVGSRTWGEQEVPVQT